MNHGYGQSDTCSLAIVRKFASAAAKMKNKITKELTEICSQNVCYNQNLHSATAAETHLKISILGYGCCNRNFLA